MNIQHWKSQPALKVWHVASLLHGIDPDELADIVINDQGDGVDINPMVDALIDGLASGELQAVSERAQDVQYGQTWLTKPSVLAWLRARQYFDLADQLDNSPPVPMKKEALTSKYESEWPQIDEDMKRQAQNGLAEAKVSHGIYDEREVVRWGRRNGRLQPGVQVPASKTIENVWPKSRP